MSFLAPACGGRLLRHAAGRGVPSWPPGELKIAAYRALSADSRVGQLLTHVNAAGSAEMVDVGSKASTQRVAVASARVILG
eukprot:scaffold1233_cov395-Prasinococcus_capsulatus_cf.AAC.5